jgi:hypothetical protein
MVAINLGEHAARFETLGKSPNWPRIVGTNI